MRWSQKDSFIYNNIIENAISIFGHEDYFIFNDGRIFSTKSARFMKTHPASNGYVMVLLCKDGKSTNHIVHRLVAKAFIPNPENKPEVNHIDGNRQNNNISNLEWCTRSENGLHSYRILKCHHPMTGRLGFNNKKSIVVYKYKDGQCIDAFFGMADAQRKTGISSSKISLVCNGKRNSTGGFNWKF